MILYRNIKTRAFTLIELLVVVAIVGLLSSIVLSSLNGARAKARDAVRISDLDQIAIALELYREDNGGEYPIIGGAVSDTTNGFYLVGWDSLTTALLPYLNVQKDPANTVPPPSATWPINGNMTTLSYYYASNGVDYDLVANLETDHPLSCRQKFLREGGVSGSPGSTGLGYVRHLGTGAGTSWCDQNIAGECQTSGIGRTCRLYSVHQN